MTKKRSFALILTLPFFVCLFLVLPQSTAAQDQNQDPGQDPAQAQVQIVDPPTRVARLNYVQGGVSFQPAGEQDWLEADINRPLTTGDNLWVDKDSRGEIHVGATSIRLSSDTGISFLNLDDRTVQLQLAQGTIEVHLRRLEPGNAFEIDTPNLAFTLAASGEYRIQADPDGNSTSIIVREGAGQVTGAGESYDLTAGQQYIFNGTDQLASTRNPRRNSMLSKIGARRRTSAKIIRHRRVTFPATLTATTISMEMETGRPIPITARSGFPLESLLAGRRIATVTGCGLARGAGLGWETSRGASRHITMGAGRTCAADIGDGCRGRWWCVRCTRRRWWDLSAVDSALAWDLARGFPEWRGFHWGRAMFTSPGIAPARVTCRTSTSPICAAAPRFSSARFATRTSLARTLPRAGRIICMRTTRSRYGGFARNFCGRETGGHRIRARDAGTTAERACD